jgi:hypothetical protein
MDEAFCSRMCAAIAAGLVAIGDNRLAIDQKRAGGQCRDRCDHERKATREVIAVASDEPDTGSVAPHQNPETVMLDSVNSLPPGRFAGRDRYAVDCYFKPKQSAQPSK